MIMNVNITDINQELIADSAGFAKRCDISFYENIKNIAETMIERGDCPVLLISGPSGSGKTTSALTLEKYLDDLGHETHTLSLDNYFKPMTEEQKILNEQGKMDLESPDRVDIDFLNSQLEDIINHKEVVLPKFNFKTNMRETGERFRLKPGEMVVIEGIHALNPDVITVPDDRTARVYVSVRTRVKTKDGLVIHPSYIRLLRRMLRDKVHRARSYAGTAAMYKSVQRGENLYIMPYKYRSQFDIDTFVPYEINVYKNMIFDGMREENMEDKVPQLFRLLEDTYAVNSDIVPKTSLIREFIGNGQFEY